MVNVVKAAALCLLVSGGFACGGGAPSLRDRLIGRSFVSESSTGVTLVAGTQMMVSFNATGFGATAGCNDYFWQFEIRDETLHVSNGGSTAVICGRTFELRSMPPAQLSGFTVQTRSPAM